jgi:DNA segregation ATPase FtsK/SpoIIIE, S-DNA-T family
MTCTERLKALPRDLCPDKRVTRAIAAKRSYRLWPVGCVIDEAQNLFAPP